VPKIQSSFIRDIASFLADEIESQPFASGELRFRNQRAAETVGLATLSDLDWKNHFLHFKPLPNNIPKPLALRYHGHQFQHYSPELGDGRGFLFAQLRDTTGRLLDLGTKGSGKTPYSRGGDGRLTLKGAVREVLATEMLEALGVNTSKTFSVFETPERLERHDEPSPTRSAVLVRLNHSHIRFGSFQRLAYLKQMREMQKLVDHCLTNFFANELALLDDTNISNSKAVDLSRDLSENLTEKQVFLSSNLSSSMKSSRPSASPESHCELLLSVAVQKSAELAASWIVAGFVHGVLNTDNMNITGESFDYGPYRFIPFFEPNFVAAYFDREGLYSFGNQPGAVFWNLQQLAQSLSLIAEPKPLEACLEKFSGEFSKAMRAKLLDRLGLRSKNLKQTPQELDRFVAAAFEFMKASKVSFAGFFFDWYGGSLSKARAQNSVRGALYSGPHFDLYLELLAGLEPEPRAKEILKKEYFLRSEPEDLLIDEIEAIWSRIEDHDDWSLFNSKVVRIRQLNETLQK
jgi:serine/tyrosine/threonine adenylyltransferase